MYSKLLLIRQFLQGASSGMVLSGLEKLSIKEKYNSGSPLMKGKESCGNSLCVDDRVKKEGN